MLMVSVSHVLRFINISGRLWLDILITSSIQQLIVPVLKILHKLSILLSVIITSVSLVIHMLIYKLSSMQLILSGVVKGVVSLQQNCCQVPGLPWFHKVFNSTTTDYIEIRACGDKDTDNEDIPVNY